MGNDIGLNSQNQVLNYPDPDPSSKKFYRVVNFGDGVLIDNRDPAIPSVARAGTPGLGPGNFIAYNIKNGVHIDGSAGNVVAGNMIGLDGSGKDAGNSSNGVLIENVYSNDNVIERACEG